MNWIVQAYADMYNVALGNTDRNNTVHHQHVEPRNTTRSREEDAKRRGHKAS